MNYANIKYCDIANGTGVRTSVFVSGCTHHCKNCFNEIAWDFNYGKLFTEMTIQDILDSCAPSYVDGLSLLGGEPMDPRNQEKVCELVTRFKERFPEKTIWCYTGYVYDKDLVEGGRAYTPYTDTLLSTLEVLVDGPFVQDLYDISLRFRGSSNQRLIDMPTTLATHEVVMWQDAKVYSTHTME